MVMHAHRETKDFGTELDEAMGKSLKNYLDCAWALQICVLQIKAMALS